MTMKPVNQTILAGIMALVMVSGFVGVYYVGEAYATDETRESETITISDSNMEIVYGIDYEPDDLSPWGDTYGTGSFKWSGSASPSLTSTNVKNNATVLYLGNDTWGATMTGFTQTTPAYNGAFHLLMIEMPVFKTHIIDEMTINMTLPTDSDTSIVIGVGGFNTPQTDIHIGGYTLVSYLSVNTRYDATITLNNVQKLGEYSIANQRETPTLTIAIYDIDHDGLSTYALEFEMTATGTPISTWSYADSVNTVIGASMIGNFAIGILMLDAIDFGGMKNDLKRATRKYKRKR